MIVQLIVGSVLALIVIIVIIPYLKAYRIFRRYSTEAKFTFFPIIGYFSKLGYSAKKYGDPLEFMVKEFTPRQKLHITNLFLEPFIILQQPALVKEMLINHQKYFKQTNYLFSSLFFEKNLVSSIGEEWNRQKKILSHSINFQFFQSMNSKIFEITRRNLGEWKLDQPAELFKSCFKISSETVSQSFLSKNLNQIKYKDLSLIQNFRQVINFSINQTLTPGYAIRSLFLSKNSAKWGIFLTKKETEVLNDLIASKKIIENEINLRIELNKKGQIFHDFLSYYLQLYLSPQNTKITMEQMIQQFQSLLTAGSDTTATLATMCLYCLAKYPEEYAKLAKLISVLEENPSIESINKISYLTYFIKQVARFYPPAFDLFPRYIKEQVTIGKYRFPKNAYMGIGIKTILRNPEIFSNSQSFTPQRWAQNLPNFTYLVFSAGPRVCIGQQLAMLEIKILIVQFIRKFNVKLNDKVKLQMVFEAIYRCKDDRLIIPLAK